MNADIIKGKWEQVKGEVKQRWALLNDNYLDEIDGSRQKLRGKVQEKYGIAREDAEKQIEEWEKSRSA